MSVQQVERALRLIEERPGRCHFVGPRHETLVRGAEEVLDLRFPPSYRTFVLALGAGNAGAAEFYGVIDATGPDSSGSVPNAVWVTLQDRRGPSRLPAGMVVVGDDGMGGNYVLDTTKGEEPPVEVWNGGMSEPGDELERMADDFGSFFLELVAEQLQWDRPS